MLSCCHKTRKMQVNHSETEEKQNKGGEYYHKDLDSTRKQSSAVKFVPFNVQENVQSVSLECNSPTGDQKSVQHHIEETKREHTVPGMESIATEEQILSFEERLKRLRENRDDNPNNIKRNSYKKEKKAFKVRTHSITEDNSEDATAEPTEGLENNIELLKNSQRFEKDMMNNIYAKTRKISYKSNFGADSNIISEETSTNIIDVSELGLDFDNEITVRNKDQESFEDKRRSEDNFDFSINFQSFVRMRSRLEEDVQYNRPSSDLLSSIYTPKGDAPKFFVDVPETYGIAADGSFIDVFNRMDVQKS